MPQSHSNLLVHVVFSTKDRRPFMNESVRKDFHAYLASVARGLNCHCFRVGGTVDHIHMAIRLHQTIALAKFIETVKSSTSRWAKTKSPELEAFFWQRGYGAFSLATPGLDPLISYIDGQEKHHNAISFQDEFRALLVEHGIEFDERYVWD